MFHVPPLLGRSPVRLSAGFLAVLTAALVVAAPGDAHADTSPPSASPSSTPSSTPAGSSSSAMSTTSSTPATGTGSAGAASSITRPSGLHDGMMPADSPDAPPAVAAGERVATAAGTPSMPQGVDVSHWQDDRGAIDWSQVAASGQRFAIVKAIEYSSSGLYTNSYLQSDLNGAHAAGMVVGAYAYAHPDVSATTQADAFATAIRGMPMPSLPPVLDLEETGGLGVTDLVTWTNAFLTRLTADTGRTPMIYTSPNFWKTYLGNSTAFAQYPLWEAEYLVQTPVQIGGWSTYSIWQYDDGTYGAQPVPGIVGAVDHDQFNTATGADLANLNGPIGMLESASLAPDGTLTISGWAFDPDTPTTSSGVTAYIDGGGYALTANISRPDIGTAYPSAGSAHGFSASYQVGPGTHHVCVYALDTTFSYLHTTLGCPTVTLVPNLPKGNLESVQVSPTGVLAVSGWTYDADTPTTAVTVQVFVDGTGQSVTANGSRPDVGAAFPGVGNSHGFGAGAQLTPGVHTVCVYGVDTYFSNLRSTLGCQRLTYTPTLPVGVLEGVQVGADGTLTVSGWSFDPDNPTVPDTVQVFVDGSGQSVTANGSRPDVGSVFPVAGNNHGFSGAAQLTPGAHTVCVYAINTTFWNVHSTLGCRRLTYTPSVPVGMLEGVRVGADGTLTVSGWSFDPDNPTVPDTVQVFVDGGGQSITANGSRPDVGSVFPVAANNHGFSGTAQLTPGAHTVCVYAINTRFWYVHSTLGCRQLTYTPSLPVGVLEAAQVAGDGTLAVSGWSFDPDNPTAPDTVQVFVDGSGMSITANGSRPDVGSVFPSAGSAHGFSAAIALSPGKHSVCVYAINTHFWYVHSTLGCRVLTR